MGSVTRGSSISVISEGSEYSTKVLVPEQQQVEIYIPEDAKDPDPWKLVTGDAEAVGGVPWSSLTPREKKTRLFIGIGKGLVLLCALYVFVCSLDLLSLGFRVVGGRTTGNIFRQSKILENPVVGVMVGILTTVLVQSSSTSTSIIVSMVSAEFLTVHLAIPIIFGSNIGTSVTNTLVSLTQVGDREQFRRAFAGATVHDMFNWLTVTVLLIIEVTTNYLEKVTGSIMDSLVENGKGGGEVEILGKITKPFVNLIVQLDKEVLECWSQLNCSKHDESSLLKDKCTVKGSEPPAKEPCRFLFHGTSMSDGLAGGIILIVSLIVLCSCLLLIVKVLNSALQGQIAVVIKKTLNAKIPYVPWITGYLAILVGAFMTFLVQSSSVFTSALTPLVGLGVLTVERVYPLTLGSNIGTTTTALLASMAVEGETFKSSMQVALCHLFFNLSGILLFYPIPFMRWPIRMAKFLGDTTAKYRWFALLYMVLMFVVVPGLFMGLSFAGKGYVIAVAGLMCVVFLFVSGVNLCRVKWPRILPPFLLTWKWLPIWLRSLEPYDALLTGISCCKRFKRKEEERDEGVFATELKGDLDKRGRDNVAFEKE